MADLPPLRTLLDDDGFRRLVAGKVVQLVARGGIRIELILADIGFDRMQAAIDEARDG